MEFWQYCLSKRIFKHFLDRRLIKKALSVGILISLIGGNIMAQTVSPVITLKNSDSGDQDDMCIWIHPDPSKSTIITSDKDVNKLFVYDLSGNTLQVVETPGQPGNIDICYQFTLSGETVDVVGYNDRDRERIVLHKIDPSTGELHPAGDFDAGSWPKEIYGFCLYRSPNTGKFYAIASGKSSQMRQWELFDTGEGSIGGIEKRTWKNGSGDQTEGLVADDETGKLYAANEGEGIYKYDADPTDPNPPGEHIAKTGENGLTPDVEGITIYYAADGEGYLIASSQGSDEFKVYSRKAPHQFITSFGIQGVGGTDGIDITNVSLGNAFPEGIFLTHNNNGSPKAVEVCAYEDLGLLIDTEHWNPRRTLTSLGLAETLPGNFMLFQNYPNPFNPATTITYTLNHPGHLRLTIYDSTGRKISTLVDGFQPAGTYRQVWQAVQPDGRNLSSGIYIAELQIGGVTKTIKMTFTK